MKKLNLSKLLYFSLVLMFNCLFYVTLQGSSSDLPDLENTCPGVGITTSPGVIHADVTSSDIGYIKVFTSNWSSLGFICNSWSPPNCTGNSSMAVQSGTYIIQVNYTNGTFCHITNLVVEDSQACLEGDLVFSTQEEIDDFSIHYPGCTEVSGNLQISGSNITNLDGLSNLTIVYENVEIFNNPQLTSLTGLSNLTTIGESLSVTDNPMLSNLDGLSGLEGGEFLTISNNAQLTNIDGLLGLDGLAVNIRIENNPMLSNLDGLANIPNVVNLILINNNAQLMSINGLAGLVGFEGNLVITNNSSLSFCSIQSVCNFLENGGFGLTIAQNAPGCNTEAEVSTGCNDSNCNSFTLCEVDFSFCGGTLSATIPNPVQVSYIKVFDSNWNALGFMCAAWENNACNGQETLSLGMGTYYVEVNYGALGSCWMQTTSSWLALSAYSEIQGRGKTNLEVNKQLSVVPSTISNPAIVVNYVASEEGIAILEVFDITGRRIHVDRQVMIEGENTIILDLPQLHPAHYFLHCTHNGVKTTSRFVSMKH